MCLEGRSAALLVALCSIVTTAGGGSTPLTDGCPTRTIGPPLSTPRISHDTRQYDARTVRDGAQIRGRLVTADYRQLTNGTLVMTPEDSDGSASSINSAMLPDGSFVFSNVQPGSYLIRALAQTQQSDTSLFALFRVTVRERDVEGIELVLRPGATIAGRIIVEPGSGVRPSTGSGRPEAAEGRDPGSANGTARGAALIGALAGLRVRAPFNDGGSFGEAQMGEARLDGSFTVQGVMAGAHLLMVDGLPPPWSVKNVTYRGQDITDTGLQADSGQRLAGVSITVTTRATEVSGTVRDGDERAAAGARVLFVPVPAGIWPIASRRYARAIANASGHYSVRGLSSGDYRVLAALELGDRDIYRRDILRAVRDQGVAITLETDQARIVDLSVIQLPLQRGGDLTNLISRFDMRASIASEPRERRAPTKRRARERVRESEGRSPSAKTRAAAR